MDHKAAIDQLDQLLSRSPDVSVRIAWRTVKPLALRARRISSTTLPAIAGIAQRAVIIRDAIDQIIPALPPTLYNTVVEARTQAIAIIDVLTTHRREEDDTPTDPSGG